MKYPNVYGIDMPSAGELIAHDRSDDEVCQLIGADKLIYQDLKIWSVPVRKATRTLRSLIVRYLTATIWPVISTASICPIWKRAATTTPRKPGKNPRPGGQRSD